MMKKNNLRILCFVLCLVIFFAAFSLTAGAKEEKYVPIEWRLDENLEYLIGGNKRYERYYAYGEFYGDPEFTFNFVNGAYYGDRYCEVYAESYDPHIVSVRTTEGFSSIFVDEEGKKILDSFLDRTDCIYYLEDYSSYNTTYCKIDEELVKYLDGEYNKGTGLREVDVRELGQSKILEINVHDKTLTKAYQYSAVYVMPNGSYYYVCFEALDNTYFDATGYFSYRSGTVKAFEITDRDRLKSINEAAQNMQEKTRTDVYEAYVIKGYYDVYGNDIYTEPVGNESDDTAAIVSFMVLSIIIGVIIPSVLLVLSLVFANSKKSAMPKCWYTLAVCAAIWLLSAIALMILIVI